MDRLKTKEWSFLVLPINFFFFLKREKRQKWQDLNISVVLWHFLTVKMVSLCTLVMCRGNIMSNYVRNV